ncbi:MAG: hypothetical protein H3C68_04200 [Deltaproteobacteria bacterium]|nr:hypothetical protein [Deltaproteobacteria bacterium]MBZ0219927.1 hypothetical protein [Deltaproteobacteria bacterium]
MRKGLLAAVMGLISAAFISTADAQYRIPLEGVFQFPDAEGFISVEDYDSGINQQEVTVEVRGLRPNSVYTAWLADGPERMQGLGVEDYSFRTDAAGNGRFIATVPEGELNRWDMLEIAYHPTGDPADLENAEIALRGDLGLYG